MSGRARLALAVVLVLGVSGSASADTAGRFALELSGERYGLVVLKGTESAQLVVSTQDLARPLLTLVSAFSSGKPVRRDVRLASGAILRKTNEARLTSVKLPQLGSGGAADVELAFAAAPLTTQPLLSAKESPPLPAGARIAGFRVDVSGMKAIEAPKLDAITLTQKADGSVVTGAIGFEAGAGGAPPFVAWQKSNGARPAARSVRIEYVDASGAALLDLQLERCTPNAVLPQGANGTTRITLTCASVHAS